MLVLLVIALSPHSRQAFGKIAIDCVSNLWWEDKELYSKLSSIPLMCAHPFSEKLFFECIISYYNQQQSSPGQSMLKSKSQVTLFVTVTIVLMTFILRTQPTEMCGLLLLILISFFSAMDYVNSTTNIFTCYCPTKYLPGLTTSPSSTLTLLLFQ